MKLLNIKGKLVNKNVSRFLIKWDGKSRSNLQFQVKQFLKPYWNPYIVYEEFPVYGSKLKVDILNASLRIAIEVHGPQHNKLHYFHNNQPILFLDSIKRDFKKIEWLEQNNFKIIEIMHNEINLLTQQWFQEKFNIIL